MTPKFSKLTGIQKDSRNNEEARRQFQKYLQRSLLLALQEEGKLTEDQYCAALRLLQKDGEGLFQK